MNHSDSYLTSSATARVAVARARDLVLEDPTAMFSDEGPTAAPRRHTAVLRVALGGGASVQQEVAVRLGVTTATAAGLVLPVRWDPTGRRRLLPSFEGELELSHAREGARVSLTGRYTVPPGIAGKLTERLIGRSLAQHSLDEFVQRLAKRVEAEVTRRVAAPAAERTSAVADGGRSENYIG